MITTVRILSPCAGHYTVHVLAPPTETPNDGDIILCHGLQPRGDYRDAWKNAWTAGDSCWPVDYLVAKLKQLQQPRPVRVLSVAYDSRLMGGHSTFEALATLVYQNLVGMEDVGQSLPTILVGHSLGGLIIKQMCVLADQQAMQHGDCSSKEQKDRHMARAFLKNLRLVAFLATPHSGTWAADFLQGQRLFSLAPVLQILTTTSTTSAQLHADFAKVSEKYQWDLQSFGETEPVKMASARSLHHMLHCACEYDCSHFT